MGEAAAMTAASGEDLHEGSGGCSSVGGACCGTVSVV